ncbi:MAG: energy transducer TonB, partial [Oxalobacteraceae bacterium]
MPTTTPNPTPSYASDAAPQAVPGAAPAAASTGVTISAAYAARNRKPDYPLMSRRYNEQGTVVLRVLVTAGGTAGEVRIGKSSGYPLLDQSALTAVRDWRFVAATRDGKPVSEWDQIP